jgi:hypothetical protein
MKKNEKRSLGERRVRNFGLRRFVGRLQLGPL